MATEHKPVQFAPIEATDEQLARLVATDPAALAELYERYLPRVSSYVRRKLRNPELEQDVVSQIFLKVIEGLQTRRIDHVRPWIFTIAHHTIVDVYRARPDAVSMESVPEPLDPSANPEDVAAALSDLHLIRSLFPHLTASEQQVLDLRLFGLTNPEIADVLGRSYSWVGSTQHRAYKRLQVLVRAHIERTGGRT